MGKLLFFFVLGVLVYWFVRRSTRSQPKAPPLIAEDMIQCAHCLTHVPCGESVGEGNERYCCEEHRRLGHD